MVRAFIQARMSSKRFPGKILAPLGGKPIIAHVLARVTQVISPDLVVVATSVEESDDPLVSYLNDLGVAVYRGPLDNVFQRFQLCLKEFPCTWFFRICADSPLLDISVLQAMMAYRSESQVDLVTNVFPRTFPRGQSSEMLYAEKFAAIDPRSLTPEEQEHLTKVYYNHSEEFRIINLVSGDVRLGKKNFAVDTIRDLQRLEKII